jgi:hypothetical protein
LLGFTQRGFREFAFGNILDSSDYSTDFIVTVKLQVTVGPYVPDRTIGPNNTVFQRTRFFLINYCLLRAD